MDSARRPERRGESALTRIVITGAGGLIGRAMARRFPDALALTHAELDITDAAAVRALRADLIINCAVVGVQESERDPALAEAVNVRGPALLAEACERLIHFSTNYVLDPVSVYARTKLEGERRCPSATIIRTSWVFGEGGENFLSTVHRRLMRGERVRATGNMFACVTYVEHLAKRVAEICRTGSPTRPGGRVHNVANDGVCSPAELAREAARLVGADPSLVEVVTDPRPASAIVTDPPLPHWRDALAEYIHSAHA
jgi:dTDP-4-dehydrorhamnose reductase